jgi:iron complex outermembrane receptor protein
MKLSKSLFLGAASSIAMAISCPAIAQTDTGTDASPEDEARMNTVIVNARKTDETLFETPVAVSVVSAEFLEETGFNTVEDIVRFVPGFDLTPLNTTRATGSKIRGISTFSFSDGFESSVATVVDGVVLGREAQGFFDFFDVEAIEIIKGPQGTLFGKNASAGVVNIRTKDPEFDFGGGFDVSYGSFNEVKARGTITGPIAEDVLAYRLSGTYNKRDGVLNNTLPGEDDINDKDTYSLRGKLLFQPNEQFTATLIGDFVKEENRCCLPTYNVAGDPTAAVLFALNPGVLQLQDALAQAGITAGPGNRDIAVFDENILQESEASGIAAKLEYEVNDNLTVTSITSWRDWEIDEFNEADGISLSNVNDRNGTESNSTQFSQEFRLNGSIGEKVDYVGGLYYFDQDLDAFGQVDIQLALPFPPFFNVRTDSDRNVKTESFAVFGEATFDVTDRFSLIVGGRFTDETIEATYQRVATPIIPTLPFGPFFGPDYAGAQTVTEDNFSGRIIGRYFWTDNLMTYLSYSKGYKGPGIDVAVSASIANVAEPGGLPVLEPEIPTLIEAGFKSTLLDDTLLANVVLFHQDVENLQAITTNAVGVTLNEGFEKVNSIGVEADVIYTPKAIDGLTLTGGFTFNEVDIAEFTANPTLEDRRFRDAPRFFYSLTGDYRREITKSGFEGFVRAEWSWQSAKNSNSNPTPSTQIDSYGLLNLRAGINSPDDRYGITFAVENATDEDYQHFLFGSSYNALDGMTRSQFLGDPVTYSVTLRANF